MKISEILDADELRRRKGDCHLTPVIKKKLQNLAGRRHMDLAPYIRFVLLKYIDDHPLKPLAPKPPEESIAYLGEVRPDAVVYKVPYMDAKIIANQAEDRSWRGLAYQPEVANSAFVWNDENFTLPEWAKSRRHLITALALISSQICSDGNTYFIMKSGLYIRAEWDGHRWSGGDVIDATKNLKQRWQRNNGFAMLDRGPFSYRAPVRQALNMLCQAFRLGDRKNDGTLP